MKGSLSLKYFHLLDNVIFKELNSTLTDEYNRYYIQVYRNIDIRCSFTKFIYKEK